MRTSKLILFSLKLKDSKRLGTFIVPLPLKRIKICMIKTLWKKTHSLKKRVLPHLMKNAFPLDRPEGAVQVHLQNISRLIRANLNMLYKKNKWNVLEKRKVRKQKKSLLKQKKSRWMDRWKLNKIAKGQGSQLNIKILQY